MRQFDFVSPVAAADHAVTPVSRTPAGQGSATGPRQGSGSRKISIPKHGNLTMCGLAALSFTSALSLSYYCLTGLDAITPRPPVAETPVYDAKAVPRDAEKGRTAASAAV